MILVAFARVAVLAGLRGAIVLMKFVAQGANAYLQHPGGVSAVAFAMLEYGQDVALLNLG